MQFAAILRSLIEESGLTQRQISSDLQIPPTTLAGYLSSHEPDIETLKRLASYFGCTVDYLIGAKSQQANSFQEDNLLRLYRALSKEQQDLYLDIGAAMVKRNGKKE